MKKKSIIVDGVKYISESEIKNGTTHIKNKIGLTYCIVRTYSAGVFAGWIDRRLRGKERTIINSRRIWYWSGAMSLSQLANDGTNDPNNCKFSQIVPEIDLTEIIEVIPCSVKAKESIGGVIIWEK